MSSSPYLSLSSSSLIPSGHHHRENQTIQIAMQQQKRRAMMGSSGGSSNNGDGDLVMLQQSSNGSVGSTAFAEGDTLDGRSSSNRQNFHKLKDSPLTSRKRKLDPLFSIYSKEKKPERILTVDPEMELSMDRLKTLEKGLAYQLQQSLVQIETAKDRLKEKDMQLEKLHARIESRDFEFIKYRETVKMKMEKVTNMEQQLELKDLSMNELRSEIKQLKRELEEKDTLRDELLKTKDASLSNIQKKQKYELSDKDGIIKQLEKTIQELKQDTESIQQNREGFLSEIRQLQSQIQTLETEKSQINRDCIYAQEKHEEIQGKYMLADRQFAILLEENRQLDEDKDQLKAMIDQYRKDNEDLQQSLEDMLMSNLDAEIGMGGSSSQPKEDAPISPAATSISSAKSVLKRIHSSNSESLFGTGQSATESDSQVQSEDPKKQQEIEKLTDVNEQLQRENSQLKEVMEDMRRELETLRWEKERETEFRQNASDGASLDTNHAEVRQDGTQDLKKDASGDQNDEDAVDAAVQALPDLAHIGIQSEALQDAVKDDHVRASSSIPKLGVPVASRADEQERVETVISPHAGETISSSLAMTPDSANAPLNASGHAVSQHASVAPNLKIAMDSHIANPKQSTPSKLSPPVETLVRSTHNNDSAPLPMSESGQGSMIETDHINPESARSQNVKGPIQSNQELDNADTSTSHIAERASVFSATHLSDQDDATSDIKTNDNDLLHVTEAKLQVLKVDTEENPSPSAEELFSAVASHETLPVFDQDNGTKHLEEDDQRHKTSLHEMQDISADEVPSTSSISTLQVDCQDSTYARLQIDALYPSSPLTLHRGMLSDQSSDVPPETPSLIDEVAHTQVAEHQQVQCHDPYDQYIVKDINERTAQPEHVPHLIDPHGSLQQLVGDLQQSTTDHPLPINTSHPTDSSTLPHTGESTEKSIPTAQTTPQDDDGTQIEEQNEEPTREPSSSMQQDAILLPSEPLDNSHRGLSNDITINRIEMDNAHPVLSKSRSLSMDTPYSVKSSKNYLLTDEQDLQHAKRDASTPCVDTDGVLDASDQADFQLSDEAAFMSSVGSTLDGRRLSDCSISSQRSAIKQAARKSSAPPMIMQSTSPHKLQTKQRSHDNINMKSEECLPQISDEMEGELDATLTMQEGSEPFVSVNKQENGEHEHFTPTKNINTGSKTEHTAEDLPSSFTPTLKSKREGFGNDMHIKTQSLTKSSIDHVQQNSPNSATKGSVTSPATLNATKPKHLRVLVHPRMIQSVGSQPNSANSINISEGGLPSSATTIGDKNIIESGEVHANSHGSPTRFGLKELDSVLGGSEGLSPLVAMRQVDSLLDGDSLFHDSTATSYDHMLSPENYYHDGIGTAADIAQKFGTHRGNHIRLVDEGRTAQRVESLDESIPGWNTNQTAIGMPIFSPIDDTRKRVVWTFKFDTLEAEDATFAIYVGLIDPLVGLNTDLEDISKRGYCMLLSDGTIHHNDDHRLYAGDNFRMSSGDEITMILLVDSVRRVMSLEFERNGQSLGLAWEDLGQDFDACFSPAVSFAPGCKVQATFV